MIIGDTDAPEGPPKASTPLLGGSGTPPDYAPRGTGTTSIGAAQVLYAVSQPAYPQRVEHSAARRFCMAFLVAFGICILASALVGSIVNSGSRSDYDRHGAEYPVPPDVVLENCLMRWLASNKESPIAGAARLPYSAEVSLDLPLPSATLMFFSKGALSAGDLNITTSAELTDVARINIAVHYVATAVRDTTKVCFLKRKAGETGVGIFTPQQWWDRRQTDRLYFEVELILPRGSYINGLATDVNNLSQDLDNLKDIITFGSIFLQGSNGPIHAKALGAANATLQTSNGEVSLDYLVALNAVVSSNNNGISGNYQVSESLDLTTSNGPIEVTVGINGSETPKSLSMHTSNSAIDAVVNLDTTSGRGGNFLVKADTSNGRLTTRIASAPLDSVLNLQAETSNSPGSVTLPLTYEGSLTMHTSNAPSFIWRVDRIEQDPACKAHSDCKGRTRTIGTHMVANGKAEGAVYWERKNANRGNVTLQSSNGAVSFYV